MLRNANEYLPDNIKSHPQGRNLQSYLRGISILRSLSAVHLWNSKKTRVQIPLLQAVVQRPA